LKIEVLQRFLKERLQGVPTVNSFSRSTPLGNKNGLERLGSKELNRGDIDEYWDDPY
jgi:hypothetical protein